MIVNYNKYRIEIVNDDLYTPDSTDNITFYTLEYPKDLGVNVEHSPSTNYGIRIFENDEEISNVILSESGGATGVQDNSLIIEGNNLLLCCSDYVYSLSLPDLKCNWRKQLDPITCFGIHRFEDDFIVHGELQITRIDINGNEKWSFSGRDI